jgi:two-component system phosphate regulon sensor histidine kinase PhoR
MSVLGFYTVSTVRNYQLDHLHVYLTNEAKLIAAESLYALNNTNGTETVDDIAKTIGNEIDARVTIISRDGTVLGDSWENPQIMENHASRPEIMAALDLEVGESTRYSTTIGQNMMYVAVPILDQENILGAARVALPTTAVENSISSAVWTIGLATAVATLLVILAAALITRMITRPMREMTKAAVRISSGQYDKQLELNTADELGLLGRAFNKMSANVRETVSKLSAEKSKLATILSSMADGVIMTDAKTRVIMANPAAESLFDFQENKILGKPLIEVVINYEINNILQKCLETNQKQSAFVDTTSGRFLMVIAVIIKDSHMPGTLLLFQDLTELRSLQTMRRQLVGNISHELRTPLAGMKAVVETLRDGAVDDKQVALDFLNKLNHEVDSMTHLINELIELSRIESGTTKLRLEPLNINYLINEIVARLAPQAEKNRLPCLLNWIAPSPLYRRIRKELHR